TIARVPMSVEKMNQSIRQLIADQEFGALYRDYRFRYLVFGGEELSPASHPSLRLLFDDGDIQIFELRAGSAPE
ncbi:MAG: hypothetical protein JW765_04405, partial [Deltaproteobacteria bacterium]|nr:hypothetical protein [Candidatus Zymogenaceae bacterium]